VAEIKNYKKWEIGSNAKIMALKDFAGFPPISLDSQKLGYRSFLVPQFKKGVSVEVSFVAI